MVFGVFGVVAFLGAKAKDYIEKKLKEKIRADLGLAVEELLVVGFLIFMETGSLGTFV